MTSTISETQAELISSLAPDDIPIKLRCAICSKLAVNAFRLPCCEQAICETCQANLPQSCPVCEHSPLSAEDCIPNKSLRTTIRVFLRTAEKKREASRPKEVKPSAPATPVEAPKPVLPPVEHSSVEVPAGQGGTGEAHVQANESTGKEEVAQEPADEQSQGASNVKAQQTQEENDSTLSGSKEHDIVQQTSDGTQDVSAADNLADTEPAGTEQENYDDSINGVLQNAMFQGSGDYNQMQMMMAMQNGMGQNSFGGFPMMGMPGMGMDPMSMQNMYMNGGFQGMGMNGMGGFGGGFTQGSNNNWNGSQSWNFDQNNYNQNGPGMGTGDFGNFNSGFQSGYNQGNYGQFNDYRHNNFGRGRGRGRGFHGGYGRGGYNQGAVANYQGPGHTYHHGSAANAQSHGQDDVPEGSSDGKQVDEYGRSIRADQGADGVQAPGQTSTDGNSDVLQGVTNEVASRDNLGSETGGSVSHLTTIPPSGNSMTGNSHIRNGSGAIPTVLTAPDVPINAPKGPKAMRQGLPNTSLHHLRARGFQVDGVRSSAAPGGGHQTSHNDQSRPVSVTLNHEEGKDYDSRRERGRERYRDDHDEKRDPSNHDVKDHTSEHSRAASRTSSRSRSHSRGHSDDRSSRRRRRQRSESVEDDGKNDSHRRKKYRSSRHSQYENDDKQSREKDDKQADRSSSASPDDSKKSSHRSRRDRDHDKRRDRTKDRHGGDEDRHRSSHRSHRDRNHESSRRRDRERDRDRDRDRDQKDRKDRHKESHRDREYRHTSSSRKHSVDGTSTPADKDVDAQAGQRTQDIGGSDSRSTHSRHDVDRSKNGKSAGKDAHTLEREARNRERLLKEAQRMAGLAGLAGGKRSREDGDDSARKSRRSSRRGEAVDDADEEERMRRLEAEREGGRWG